MNTKFNCSASLAWSVLIVALGASAFGAEKPPQVGETAPNFTLRTLDDKPVELRNLTSKRVTAVVVLRGWPGYQCPLCERQVSDMVRNTAKFKEHDAQLVFIYPGPAADLKAHAQEFLGNKQWPDNFRFVTDPDYTFTTAYGLRWDAPKETAYPSTFIIDQANKVRFAQVSKSHGGRVTAEELLKQLDGSSK